MKEPSLTNPKISQYTRMKSSKILKKSEDCQGFTEDCSGFPIYWGFKCNILRNPDQRTDFRINVQWRWMK